jgi:tripartite-type tricarboxylate transporter receptor subunit TctC
MSQFCRRALLALAAASLVAAPGKLLAAYPEKPVRIIVPFAAGGGVDILTRVLAHHLSERLGQQFIVDDKPGAGGNLGTEAAAKSSPDGYTLLVGTTGTHSINPGLYKHLPYDAVKDFAPIGIVASVPNVLVVNPDLPVHSVRDLIAAAKAEPGKLTFGSFGNGTSNHLSGELLKRSAQIDILHVPYKNAPQAVADVIAGTISLLFVNTPLAMPHVQAGKLRALAVTSAKRSASLPDLPTMVEAGVPDFAVESWYALFAPTGTPAPIVSRIHDEVTMILAKPEVKEFYAKQGAEPVSSTATELAATIERELPRWAELIKYSGAQID